VSILTNIQDNQDYILTLCQTLSIRGKQPTVALIRSHANRSLTIPQVIKVLQAWKQNPQALGVLKTPPERKHTGDSRTLEQRIEELEQQVAQMSKQLSAWSK
jgi:uncharacterized protein YceH (UPF0502 family)